MATVSPYAAPPPQASLRRYSTVAMWFHWIIAAMVILNLVVGLLHEPVPALRPLMGVHKAIGITVLVLTAARVAWRLTHRPPPLPAQVAAWQKGLAHATHWGLYLLLIAMPMSGWVMASGPEARPLTWFGLFAIPYLPVTAGAAEGGHAAHGLLGWIMLTLVGLHVAGALYHRAKRDGVVWRMAPWLEPR